MGLGCCLAGLRVSIENRSAVRFGTARRVKTVLNSQVLAEILDSGDDSLCQGFAPARPLRHLDHIGLARLASLAAGGHNLFPSPRRERPAPAGVHQDRKSTRLNSSH